MGWVDPPTHFGPFLSKLYIFFGTVLSEKSLTNETRWGENLQLKPPEGTTLNLK